MTVPVPEGYATTTDSGRSGSTLSLNIPAGVNSGEVLYAVVTDDATSNAISWPSGWTEIWAEHNGQYAENLAASGAFKYADGTESGTISVTVSGSTAGSCGIMWRISGAADPRLVPPAYQTLKMWDTVATVGDTGGSYSGAPPVEARDLSCDDYLAFTSLHISRDPIMYYTPEQYAEVTKVSATANCQMYIGHRNCPNSPMEAPSIWDYGGTTQIDTIQCTVLFYPRNKFTPPSDEPFVRAIKFTEESGRTTSTSFYLNLPDDIKPGDVLLGIIYQNDCPNEISTTWPSGWTELFESSVAQTPGVTTYVYQTAAWKLADGSETGKVLVPTISENVTGGAVLVLGNVNLTTNAVDVRTNSSTNGSSSSLTVSHGAANYLYVSSYVTITDDVPLNDGCGWVQTWNDSRFLSRAITYTNNTVDPTNALLCIRWGVLTSTTVTPGTVEYFQGGDINTVVMAFYPTTPEEVDNWWYLGWEGKGRGYSM